MRAKITYLILCLSLLGCDQITKEIENYDLFGLDQAQEGIKESEKKIEAARAYQKKFSPKSRNSYNTPNILGNY